MNALGGSGMPHFAPASFVVYKDMAAAPYIGFAFKQHNSNNIYFQIRPKSLFGLVWFLIINTIFLGLRYVFIILSMS